MRPRTSAGSCSSSRRAGASSSGSASPRRTSSALSHGTRPGSRIRAHLRPRSCPVGQARDERSRVPHAHPAAARLARARGRAPRGAVATCAERSSPASERSINPSSKELPTPIAGTAALPSTHAAPDCTSPSGPMSVDGPHVEVRDGRASVVHGSLGGSLEDLQRRGRPVRRGRIRRRDAPGRTRPDGPRPAVLSGRRPEPLAFHGGVPARRARRRPRPTSRRSSAAGSARARRRSNRLRGHPEAAPGPLVARGAEPAPEPASLLGPRRALRQVQG